MKPSNSSKKTDGGFFLGCRLAKKAEHIEEKAGSYFASEVGPSTLLSNHSKYIHFYFEKNPRRRV